MDPLDMIKRNAGNQAVLSNPGPAFYNLTRGGSSFLWAEFCVMTFAQIVLLVFTYLFMPVGRRALHWLGLAILTISMVHYFIKASNLGGTPIRIIWYGPPVNTRSFTRQIFYVKWVSYALTGPLTVLLLLLPTAIPLADLLIAVFAVEAAVVAGGLIPSLIATKYKFGLAVVGAYFFVWLLAHLWSVGLRAARRADNMRNYLIWLGYLTFFWPIYAIAWGCADGSNLIQVTSGEVWFGILDFFTGPVFLALYFGTMSDFDYERMGLRSSKASMSFTESEAARSAAQAGTSEGVGQGTAGKPGHGHHHGTDHGQGTVTAVGTGDVRDVPGAHAHDKHHHHGEHHHTEHHPGQHEPPNVGSDGDRTRMEPSSDVSAYPSGHADIVRG